MLVPIREEKVGGVGGEGVREREGAFLEEVIELQAGNQVGVTTLTAAVTTGLTANGRPVGGVPASPHHWQPAHGDPMTDCIGFGG